MIVLWFTQRTWWRFSCQGGGTTPPLGPKPLTKPACFPVGLKPRLGFDMKPVGAAVEIGVRIGAEKR